MICATIAGPVLEGFDPDQEVLVAALEGYEVRGRIARLGIVVTPATAGDTPRAAAELVVIGGRSSLLHYRIPLEHVTRVSQRTRSVSVDVDVVDFTPRILDDGSVELHITG